MVLLRMLAFRPADDEGAPRTSLKSEGVSPATTDSTTAAVAASPQRVEPAVERALPSEAAPSPAQPAPATAALPDPKAKPEPAPKAESAAAPFIDVPWNEPPSDAPVAADAQTVTLRVEAPVAPAEHHATVVAVSEPDDDEPPLSDEDYYQAETLAEAYLDELDAPPVAAESATPLAAVEPATGLAADWLELYLKLGLSGLTGSIAANCTLISVQGDHWLMHLDPAQSALFNATQQRRLNDALNQYHGRTIQLDIELQKPQQETPAQAAERRRAERQRAAEQAIQSDPVVRQLIDQFAAVIREGSIEPLA